MKKDKKEKKRLCAPGLPTQGDTLDEMLDCYCRVFRPNLAAYLDVFRKMKLKEAIENASGKPCPCCGKCHPHQKRLTDAVHKIFTDELKKRRARIEKAKDFEKLYELVCEARVWGIGPVTLYDAALRISATLSVLPQKIVYLQGKAVIPYAERLHQQEISCFDDRFSQRKMTAYEIEEFLCCFHKRLSEKAIIVTKPSK